MRVGYVLVALLVFGCAKESQPKPNGYLRLEYPDANYVTFTSLTNFSIEKNALAEVKIKNEVVAPRIVYPGMKATLYLNYSKVENNLDSLLNDAYRLPYKHISKAESIPEKIFINKKNKVYGTLFSVVGNAASQYQFFLTDSIDHFLVGSLYFYARPNYDSIYPAANYLKKDIIHLMETLQWK
ncbi:MAG: gliding motility-associated lipoprotein GldD [Flavobacteriaceae bacterium]|jgi:gliding motility-associated lipoprotein GldD|tara:strand:+ start:2524 stop:3072 length:549 start_codon:yes stop_codon:yes gene_type:complete